LAAVALNTISPRTRALDTTFSSKAGSASENRSSAAKSREQAVVDEFLSDNEYTIELLPDALELYMHSIKDSKPLGRDEERALARQAKAGDEVAQQKLLFSNLRRVVQLAHQYWTPKVEVLDLIAAGNRGLMRGQKKYDPDHKSGARVLSYADRGIRQEIERCVDELERTVRLPVHRAAEIRKMLRTAAKLREELQEEPTNWEIAARMSVPVERVEMLKDVDRICVSPDDYDFLELTGGRSADDVVAEFVDESQLPYRLDPALLCEMINQKLATLDSRAQGVLNLRFGLDGNDPKTLEEVAQIYHVTRERVRQIQNIALKQLRHPRRLGFLAEYLSDG
jgi:RNA polymerase primary sigma factor